MEKFGIKLRALRKKYGLTLRDLAEALEFSTHGYIGDLEAGRRKPSLELAVKIADYFQVPLDVLARDEVELD
jgi:transcriptional regulator with XRE-family HTH domain